MIKKTLILLIISIGYLAWAGGLRVSVVQAQDGTSDTTTVARDSADEKDRRKSRIQDLIEDDFGKNSSRSAASSPSPTIEPTETPVALESPSPTATARPKSNSGALASIVDFFKNASGPNSSATNTRADRGLNLFGSGTGSASYGLDSTSEKKIWYGLIGALGLVGVSTFMYGRSKHT